MSRVMTRWGSLMVAANLVLCTPGAGFAQSSGSDQMMGRHSMQGEVTSLDAKKGWIHLKTAEGTMIMHFPPESLQGVKKGDRVSVDLALKDNGPKPKSR
jgi:hypothetical protein